MSTLNVTSDVVAGTGHVPSDSQLPKQCWIVIASPVISGKILSLKLFGSAHSWPSNTSLVPQSFSFVGPFKNI